MVAPSVLIALQAALAFTPEMLKSTMAARMPRLAMTTSSSTRVNPAWRRRRQLRRNRLLSLLFTWSPLDTSIVEPQSCEVCDIGEHPTPKRDRPARRPADLRRSSVKSYGL